MQTYADLLAGYLKFIWKTLTPQGWAEIQKVLPLISSKEDYAALMHEKLHATTGVDLDSGWQGWQLLKLLMHVDFADLIRVADGITGKISRKDEIQRFREAVNRVAAGQSKIEPER